MSLEIESLVRAFEDGSLPGEGWTHDSHLLVALWYLHRYPRAEATRRIRDGIKHYNSRRGNRTGYHETITLAWIAVISGFLASQGPEPTLADLAERLLNSCGRRDFLLRFYSRERLFSEQARQEWMSPDREPLESAFEAPR